MTSTEKETDPDRGGKAGGRRHTERKMMTDEQRGRNRHNDRNEPGRADPEAHRKETCGEREVG